jgi:hypothetical protein
MFVPHRKHITSPLRAQKRLMRSIGLWRCYINITVTVVDIIHRPVFYLNHTMNTVCTSKETHYVTTTGPKRLMRSIGLWRLYMTITIKILHRIVTVTDLLSTWSRKRGPWKETDPKCEPRLAADPSDYWPLLRLKVAADLACRDKLPPI